MMAEPSLTPVADRGRAYAARLIAEPLPAVVINGLTSEIVAANAGGLSALGLTRAIPLPYAMDSAMPAISAVRALAKDGLISPAQRALIFWRNGRAVTLPCHIARADADLTDAVAIATHVTIIFQPPSDQSQINSTPAPRTAPPLPAETIAANDDPPPRIERDDSETLKEIARRIREAQRAARPDIGSAADIDSASTSQYAPEKPPRAEPEQPPAPTPAAELRANDASLSAPNIDTGSKLSLAAGDIAKLAHELKTPLTAIAAAAEIMRDERLGVMGNHKYLGYAADIHSSATHALAVIQDMLAYPSGGSDRQHDAFKPCDLTELARDTVSSLQPLAGQRRLTLTLDAEPRLTLIRANATAVRQILLNLLTNALKFTPPGGEVRVVTGYLNDGAVFIVVRDTGEGIDEATLARSYDDGANELTARAGGGQGIGLRLVRRLAAENGAEFEIDTMPGRGTIVMLAFAKDLASSAL